MLSAHNMMILEPGALTIENGPTNQRMTEVWKGPWSELRKLADLKSETVFSKKIYPGIERPDFTSPDWSCEFSAP